MKISNKKTIALSLLFVLFFSIESISQVVCPTFSSGNLGNGGTSGTLPFTNPARFSKSGNFTFTNATDLDITAAYINGSKVQTSSGITSGSNFYFTHLRSNNMTYYSDLNGNDANLRAGTYAFTFTNGTSTSTCTYTISVSGSNFSIVNLNPGSIGNAQTICSNTSPASLSMVTSASGGATPYSYQWQSSTDGVSFSDVSSGGTSSSYSPGNLSATKYYQLKVTDANSNVATTNAVKITVNGSTGVWLGTTNTDFNTASNWCGSNLPTSSTDVFIGSTSNKPVVTSDITVKSLTIQNGGSLRFSGGILTATNGITIKPGGALIGSSQNISGTVTMEQFFTPQRGWRVLSHPFTTSSTFSTIATNNNMSIETQGANNASGLTDVRLFNNTDGTWSNGSTSISANTPYAIFYRGTASEVSKLNYSGGPSTITYGVSGTLNGSSVSITPGSTSYFTIVGNPYAAPVNTKALTGQTSQAYYTYQVTASATETNRRGKSGSWVAAGSNSDNTTTIPVLGVVAYLPSSVSSFNITPSDINNGGTLITGLFATKRSVSQLELLLENSNGDYADKLFIRLDPTANPSGNDKLDLKKLYNENNNFYTLSEDKTDLAIDARNKLDIIPLVVNAPAGEYQIKIGGDFLQNNTPIYIKDNYTNKVSELTSNSKYAFSITDENSSKIQERFQLFFGTKPLAATDENTGADFKIDILDNIIRGYTVAIRVSGLRNNFGSIRIVNANGQITNTTTVSNGIQYIGIGSKSQGLHFLYVTDGYSNAVRKLIKL